MPAINDQENVNRLVSRVAGRFAYLPSVRVWLRKEGEEWSALPDGGEIMGEYVDLIAESEPRSFAALVLATCGQAQSRVLDMLQRDPRLSRRLTDFPPHSLRHFCRTPLNPGAPSDPTLLTNGTFRTFCTAYFPDEPDLLGTFCHRALFQGDPPGSERLVHAHAHAYESRLFLRTVSQAADPDPLYDLLYGSYGELVCRLPRSLWTKWPDNLTPPWALRLYGTRLVFLDGCEKPRDFTPESLRRLLCRETADWVGRDGIVYQLPLPGFFVLTGQPVSLEDLRDGELRALALEARPLWQRREDADDPA